MAVSIVNQVGKDFGGSSNPTFVTRVTNRTHRKFL